MGSTSSKLPLVSRFFTKERRIIMIGLDSVGKTSILYRLLLGENIKSIPTAGFNFETVKYNNINFNIWDISGLRTLWNHYFCNT